MTKKDFMEKKCSSAFIYCLKNNDRKLLVEYAVANLDEDSEEIDRYVELFDIVKQYPMIKEQDISNLVRFAIGPNSYCYY